MKSICLTISAGALGLAALAPTSACLSGGSARTVDCGAGDGFRYAGVDYCIFGGAIIIEGFDCPEAAPFGFEAGGAVVCSPTETAPEGGWAGVVDAWRDGPGRPPGDATGDGGEVATGPVSACDVAFDRPVGQRVAVVDVGECPVERRCAAGVVARCDNGLWACDCAWGAARCVGIPEATCPAHDAAAGAACLPELGEDACADGLYCAEDRRCAPLPTRCEGGCFEDADCEGACVGGSRVAGRLGRCVAANAPGACWDASDCPAGWSCEGVVTSCQPCAPCPSPLDYAGQCRAASDAIGLAPGSGAEPIVGLWWLAASYSLLDCPSLTLEVRDEKTGAWIVDAAESACAGPVVPPASTPVARTIPALPASPFAWTWVRARGALYTGCAGSTPGSCQTGPIEVVSEPLLVRD